MKKLKKKDVECPKTNLAQSAMSAIATHHRSELNVKYMVPARAGYVRIYKIERVCDERGKMKIFECLE